MKTLFVMLILCLSVVFGASAQGKGKKNKNMKAEIAKNWVQGKVTEKNAVVAADPSRAGWYYVNIKPNGKVTFKGTFDCGFGTTREGTWMYDEAKSIVTFKFTKKVGYDNNPVNEAINETESYQVEKATGKELILKPLAGTKQEKTLAMIISEE